MPSFSGVASPQFALRKVPSTAPSLPSYVTSMPSNSVKTVSTNTVTNVAAPNPFNGINIGSIGAGNFWCQGCAILNPYYSQWGAMVAHGLTGHASTYFGGEAYIAAFDNVGAAWVRRTNPMIFGATPNENSPEYDQSLGEWKYLGGGSQDYFGHYWCGDHTRGYQVAVSGGTGNQGRLFHPKAGYPTGALFYSNRAHTFDCGVETGTPTYDRTKQWSTRAVSAAPISPVALSDTVGGGCWFEPDTNQVAWLILNTTFSQTKVLFFDLNTNDWTTSIQLTLSHFGATDGAVEYIASRKLAIAFGWAPTPVAGPVLYDRSTLLGGKIENVYQSSWAAPPFSPANPKDWNAVNYANRLVYSPVDGNFYCLDIIAARNPSGPKLWRFTPPVDLRTSISNHNAMAVGGGSEASRWTDLTPSLTGDAIPTAGSGINSWGIYNGLQWHDKFSCFVVCSGQNNPIQLIKPPTPAPTPG